MRTKLTSAKIEKLESESTQYFVWDEKFTGLGLRVSPGGSKTFIYQGRVGGRGAAKRVTIGKFPLVTLQMAIDQAAELSQQMAAGIDPGRQKAEQLDKNLQFHKGKAKKQITFGQAFSNYVHIKQSDWSANYLKDHIRAAHPHLSDPKYKAGCLDYIWDTNLIDLTPELIEKWVRFENKTRKTRMAQAYRMYKAFVNWANERNEYAELIPDRSATAKMVTTAIKKTGRHKEALQRQQLKMWFDLVLSDKVNSSLAAALICMLMNGSRPDEMLSLTWDKVDFDWKTITITDKVDQWERQIPLTPYVEHLMKGLPKINQYVFGSTRGDKTHIKPNSSYRKALLDAGLPPLPPKSMRKSFSNLSEWVSVPYGIVKQIMGHRPTATDEKHYKDRPIDLLRHWHVIIEQFILAEAGIDFTQFYPNLTREEIYSHVIPIIDYSPSKRRISRIRQKGLPFTILQSIGPLD